MKKNYILLTVLILLSGKQAFSLAPPPCLPDIVITPLAGTFGCYSFAADNGVAADPDMYYTWDFGDGTIENGRRLYHCYPPSSFVTNYQVTLTYHSPSCGSPVIQSYFIVLNSPDTSMCIDPVPAYTRAGDSISITPVVSFPEIMFQYHYGDGYWSGFDLTHTYSSCGNYILTVKRWDMNFPGDTCYGYAAVNHIGCSAVTGLQKIADMEEGMIFPVPCREALYVKKGLAVEKAEIRDLSGRTTGSWYYAAPPVSIDVEGLGAGAYILVTTDRKGNIRYLWFIKNNE
jgi:hypothetical protein